MSIKKKILIKESDWMKERDTHTQKKPFYSYYLSKEIIFF